MISGRPTKTWTGGYTLIFVLCTLDLIFAVLVCWGYLTHDSIGLEKLFFVIGILAFTTGLATKPVAWIVFLRLLRNNDLPRSRKTECMVVLIFSTFVFLRILLAALNFRA